MNENITALQYVAFFILIALVVSYARLYRIRKSDVHNRAGLEIVGFLHLAGIILSITYIFNS